MGYFDKLKNDLNKTKKSTMYLVALEKLMKNF